MSTASKQELWVNDVKGRPQSMSQRKHSVVESWPGGVKELVRVAKSQGVHLVQVVDDHGDELIAASVHPFKVLS